MILIPGQHKPIGALADVGNGKKQKEVKLATLSSRSVGRKYTMRDKALEGRCELCSATRPCNRCLGLTKPLPERSTHETKGTCPQGKSHVEKERRKYEFDKSSY